MSPSTSEPEAEQPGKTRTWWHPLLASVLRWQLVDHYRVEEEVNVGKKPLQIDILLLQQQQGDLPDSVRRLLAGLVEYLNEYTLLEFKSPSDTLRAGDFQTFLAYALLYRAQNQPLLPVDKLNLLVLAPRLTKPYRQELQVCGVTAEVEQPGIWRLRGGVVLHATWLLETEVLAEGNHPLLTVFSPQLLNDPVAVSQRLRQQGYGPLVVYVSQQIQQFHLQGERFAMQHLRTEEELQQVWQGIIDSMTLEQRLEFLQALKLPPEHLVEGLTPEQREELLALLQKEQQQLKKPKRGKKT